MKKRNFWSELSAVVSIEFALILPVLIVLFFGSINVFLYYNQVAIQQRIATNVADLISTKKKLCEDLLSSAIDYSIQDFSTTGATSWGINFLNFRSRASVYQYDPSSTSFKPQLTVGDGTFAYDSSGITTFLRSYLSRTSTPEQDSVIYVNTSSYFTPLFAPSFMFTNKIKIETPTVRVNTLTDVIIGGTGFDCT